MNRQRGFTLLELVIALAIFALLSLAGWRLLDGLLRVQAQVTQHEQALRELQRAVAVLERDVLHLMPGAGLQLHADGLNLQRGHWRNPLDEARSERQRVSYRLEQGSLWRYSAGADLPRVHKQRLLREVSFLQWRLYDEKTGWQTTWRDAKARPRALEVSFTTSRFTRIRRVIPLPEGS